MKSIEVYITATIWAIGASIGSYASNDWVFDKSAFMIGFGVFFGALLMY